MPVIAIGAVGLIAVAAGLLALFFIFAAPTITRLINYTLGNLPLIGGQVAGVVTSALGAFTGALYSFLDETVRGAGEWLWAEGAGHWMLMSQVVSHLTSLTDSIWSIQSQIAGTLQSAIGVTQNYYNLAIGEITGVDQSLIAAIQNVDGSLLAELTGVDQSLIAAIQTVDNNLASALDNWVGELQAEITGVDTSLEAALSAVNNALASTIANDVAALTAEITGVDTSLEAALSTVNNDLASALNSAVSNLQSEITTVANSVGAEGASILNQAEGYAAAAANALGTEIAGVDTSLEGFIESAENSAINAASNLAAAAGAAAVATVEGSVGADVIGPWDVLLPDLVTIGDAIGAEASEALGLGAAIADTDPSTIAGVLSVAIPAIGAIAREVADCSVPMCTNLGGFSSLLGDLGTYAALAGIFAFALEAAENPSQAVTDLQDVIVGPVNDAVAGVRTLIGV